MQKLNEWFHTLPLASESSFLKKTGYLESLSLDKNVRFYDGETLLPMDDPFLNFIDKCGSSLSKQFFVIPVVDYKDSSVHGLILKGEDKASFKYIRKGWGFYMPPPKKKYSNVLCLVEGIKDMYIPYYFGIDTVCLLGVSVDAALMDFLGNKRVYCFFDNDTAGDKAFWGLKNKGVKSTLIRGKYPPNIKDFGDGLRDKDTFMKLAVCFSAQVGIDID